ncbi:Cysteine and glycine-rich protein 1 [Mortierella sp. GBA30]|nr:Cysteine and glycine-rich protein 1 [Mortierella sp. GBA30]
MSKTDPYITHNKRSWHTTCFVCFQCRVDLSQRPMVDIRGRPCCEDCLMAQAGQENQDNDSSTPVNRSLNGSPAPSPSPITKPSNNNFDSVETTYRTRLSLPPLDLNLSKNNALMATNSPSPLSALSTSSQSSFAASLRQSGSASSGYSSGTSSTYSSLGRKRADSAATPSGSIGINALLNKGDLHQGSPTTRSPHPSFQRPSSALSIHSYTSSRPSSPVHSERDYLDEDGVHVVVDKISRVVLSQGQRHSRTPSQSSTTSANVSHQQQLDDGMDIESRNSSRPETPNRRRTSVLDRYPLALSATEVDLVASTTEKLHLSTPTSATPPVQQMPPKPRLSRARSRSSVGPTTTSGMVRARTEAWMSQTQLAGAAASAMSSTTPKAGSQLFTPNNSLFADRRHSTAFNVNGASNNLKPTLSLTSISSSSSTSSVLPEKAFKESKEPSKQPGLVSKLQPQPQAEPEPSRTSSIYRHGRQRSNTVGEAVNFPVVHVDARANPTLQRGTIPENHCHKCLEKVTENGIRLQNGDRFHIGCFLCHGCKQVFTESEFHIVLGRPYHPGCHKVIGNKSIRFAGMNYHPQCFACTHCHQVLHSASRFFEVDGRVECEQCCQERDRERLAPKIVPAARAADHFPVPPPSLMMEPSGPGNMMTSVAATNTSSISVNGNLSRSGSTVVISGRSSPSFASEDFKEYDGAGNGFGRSYSPVLVMASSSSSSSLPLAIRSEPPALTSLFSTRTRPLPKFGGVTNCPRCQQPVGVMDQVPGPKNEKWHKKCLNCKECKKVLDSSCLTRGDGEAYCRGCFNKTRVRP